MTDDAQHSYDRRATDPQIEALRAHVTEVLNASEARTAVQFNALETRVDNLDAKIKENTDATERVEAGTLYIIDLMRSASFLRRMAIWVAPFLTVGAGIWAMLHGHNPFKD
jgi:hypothetical protein